MSSLPVTQCLAELKSALSQKPATILTAETGSGKTTWLPLQLLSEPWLAGKKIIMLEPRRVAARAAAHRLAFHAGDALGKTVGYSVRFDSKVSNQTRLEVVTEGVLARRIVNDPELKDVGLVIFDEFHERHVETDLALALTLESMKVFRPDLKILVMSATIDTTRISNFLEETLEAEAPIITAAGTNFPVEIKYLNEQVEATNKAMALASARKAIEAHGKHEGDILIFLPGTGEIFTAMELIEARNLPHTDVLPLYGELTSAEQDLVLAPAKPGRRRIIAATPIAESSLTVDGLTVVVDSGLVRQPAFDPGAGISHLETVPITQDSAVQRSGRAGRLKPGVCYRMYHEADFKRRPRTRAPEILRTDLADACLRTLSFGSALRELALIDRPSDATLTQAERLLHDLGCTTNDRRLTELGKAAAKIPLSPRLAMMLAQVPTEETARLAAELSERESGSVQRTYEQLLKYVTPVAGRSRSYPRGSTPLTERALLFAYPDRICIKRETGSFLMRGGRGVVVEKGNDLADAEFIIAIDLAGGEKNAKLRHGVAVSREEVFSHFRDFITQKQVVREINGRPRAYAQTCLDAIVLTERETELSPEHNTGLLRDSIKAKGLQNLWNGDTANFCARVEMLRAWGEDFPSCDPATLTASIDEWLLPFLDGVRSLAEVAGKLVHDAIVARFDYSALKRLENLLPERIAMPSGSSHAIEYSHGKAKVSVRIQEVFGLDEHPALAGGKLPLTLELLSPGRQPIATTLNLPGFWKSTYTEVRKEMRGRYPRHFWPEDPLSMQGTTGTKKAFDRKTVT